jgi:hypothetical protein
MSWTDPKVTMLESWLSRGDRRMAQVIHRAWQNGARFDAWQEHFNYEAWMNAFEDSHLDPAFYTHRERSQDEVFPWEHIHTGVRKSYLRRDYLQSQKSETRPDCRQNCYACGILPVFADLRRENPGEAWMCPEVKTPSRQKIANTALS